MTEAAVMCFQESKQLRSTGLVDEETFDALGAASSDARYSETRNLFRWVWNRYLAGQADTHRP
ncbi:hypothetical protein Enr13x_33000 [Stieleria neptunia]|uniref:Peptidoglycan binding-like domain-containing protein n=2 Tax=Stieleria neptunia TaxID=2527979 RepID=A0A518HRG9_9BACT|nr:hypothetical protein Enr13x_33000 [Stieleria neptunia]